jgi:hypothetical protein
MVITTGRIESIKLMAMPQRSVTVMGASYVIISGRAEGADMPTGKTKSRCAWEAVNAPAVRCLVEKMLHGKVRGMV